MVSTPRRFPKSARFPLGAALGTLLGAVAIPVLATVLFLSAAPVVRAQDAGQQEFGPENAVMVKGPTLGRELPFLGPNVVRFWRATYEYQNDTFVVFFTRDPVFGLGEWTQGQCGNRQGRYRAGEGAVAEGVAAEIWHLSADGINEDAAWHLFVDVGDFTGDACRIMPAFTDRLQFFFDALGADSRESPLPAVVGPAL
jgi:hypothetical protein